ncbi:hypothetical protein GGR56DRAFT_380189 [Xylariaceae sp. FL0804]|nr:hypothetical protein GGR56DRAFT_380189 [Xylariaceae sp. FL0804]
MLVMMMMIMLKVMMDDGGAEPTLRNARFAALDRDNVSSPACLDINTCWRDTQHREHTVPVELLLLFVFLCHHGVRNIVQSVSLPRYVHVQGNEGVSSFDCRVVHCLTASPFLFLCRYSSSHRRNLLSLRDDPIPASAASKPQQEPCRLEPTRIQ